MTSKTLASRVARGAVISALYYALTMLFEPISFMAVQFRISEVLCILPFFFAEAIPGLFVGCVLANLTGSPFGIWDAVFGSLATLTAAFATYKCRIKWLAPMFPVIINGLVVGGVLAAYLVPEAPLASFPLFAVEVAAGEFGVMYALGLPLLLALERRFAAVRG
jgi:uncharacterized membrane protein